MAKTTRYRDARNNSYDNKTFNAFDIKQTVQISSRYNRRHVGRPNAVLHADAVLTRRVLYNVSTFHSRRVRVHDMLITTLLTIIHNNGRPKNGYSMYLSAIKTTPATRRFLILL